MTTSNHTTLYCIYRIVNFQTGEIYVGQTCDLTQRRQQHFAALRRGDHRNQHLQAAYNKYGKQAFYFEMIEADISQNDVNDREVFWISHFDSFLHGYNHTPGGASRGLWSPCEWNGVFYQSILLAARVNGISSDAMRERAKRGWKSDEDMAMGIRGYFPCSWNGIHYSSISEAARACGISYATMKERIEKGYVSDSDIKHDKKGSPCTWNGITYPSAYAAAQANNVRHGTMNHRLKMGWVCDADIPNRRKKSR